MFGEATRAHRLQWAITQEELAVKAGLGVRTVRDIEAGRVGRPRQGTVRALADAFALQGDEREHFYTAAFSHTVRQPAAPEVTVERIDQTSGEPLAGGRRPLATLIAPVVPMRTGSPATRLRRLAAAAIGILPLISAVSWGINVYGYQVMGLLAPDRVPVHISVHEQPGGGSAPEAPPASRSAATQGVGGRWVFGYELPGPQTVAELNGLVGREAVGAWVLRKGGFDLGSTFVRLVLQGVDPYVEIVNIRARAVEWVRPIPSATLVDYSPEGAGRWPKHGNETLTTTLNLDKLEPSALYFLGHTIPLQPHESVAIDLQATITAGAVVWDIAVDMVVAGKKRTLVVTRDDGLRFRTAASLDQKPDRAGPTAPRFPYEEYRGGFVFDMGRNPPSWKPCVPQECFVSRERPR